MTTAHGRSDGMSLLIFHCSFHLGCLLSQIILLKESQVPFPETTQTICGQGPVVTEVSGKQAGKNLRPDNNSVLKIESG